MKKAFIGLIFGSLFVMGGIAPQIVHAAATDTWVTGVVTDHGHPVAGAQVLVSCDSAGKPANTDATGTYMVALGPPDCSPNSTIAVEARSSDFKKVGGAVGTRSGETTTIDVPIGVAYSVPEYGWLAGALAAGAGVGAMLVIRRRYAGQGA